LEQGDEETTAIGRLPVRAIEYEFLDVPETVPHLYEIDPARFERID
jgi:hypothetical protein